jgi:hypothetical protein
MTSGKLPASSGFQNIDEYRGLRSLMDASVMERSSLGDFDEKEKDLIDLTKVNEALDSAIDLYIPMEHDLPDDLLYYYRKVYEANIAVLESSRLREKRKFSPVSETLLTDFLSDKNG